MLFRSLDALNGITAHTVVTTGPSIIPDTLTSGPNTETHGFLPHDTVLPRATLVIGHGGHDTTLRGLAHDVPLVVMPMHPLADHRMIGRALETQGAAQCLHPADGPDRIRAAVDALLNDGPHRAAAANLGKRIRAHNGATRAADLIETLPPLPTHTDTAPTKTKEPSRR